MPRQSILIIQDHQRHADWLATAFDKARLKQNRKQVKNGQDGITYLKSTRQPPCMIIVDLSLPDQSGLDVLRFIQGDSRFRWIPTIVISAKPDQTATLATYQMGGNSFIVLPPDPEVFCKTMLDFCQYWFQVVKLPASV